MRLAFARRKDRPVHCPAARELRQRSIVLRRRRQRLIALRRRELLRRARPAKLGLESTELLGHELELARQRPELRLDRIDPGGETGGIAETLACIAAGIFLRQRHIRLCLHERFERGHHGLKIGDLLLQPADSIRRCGGRGRRGGAPLPEVPAVVRPGARPLGRKPGQRRGEAGAPLPPMMSPSAIACAQSKSKRSRGVSLVRSFVLSRGL